jgi:dihydropteroate synthase
MKYRMRILNLTTRDELIGEMKRLGADPAGIGLMFPKALTRPIRLSAVPCKIANLLKQELLSRGGDCAVSHGTLAHSVEATDVLMIGTERQYRKLIRKLKSQRFFGLPELSEELTACIRNYNRDRFSLTVGKRSLDLGERTHVMGVINVTPDSFSDGGTFMDSDRAVQHARRLVEEGADIIDVGGESTRPGAGQVSEAEECDRVLPIVERLAREHDMVISVDTYKAGVARKAIAAGAHMINDISGLRFDPDMASVIAETGVPVVLMHIKGTPRDMQRDPVYEDLMGEILGLLEESIGNALRAGIREDQIIIDPGIGFGKRLQDNLDILKNLGELRILGRPILLGTSRKSFIGTILDLPVEDRLEGTAATVCMGIMNGARIVRVHDVRQMVRVARMTDAVIQRR